MISPTAPGVRPAYTKCSHVVSPSFTRVPRSSNSRWRNITVACIARRFVAGWSLIASSWRMLAYAGVLAISFHLRVIFYEEPTLARLFGNEWERYRASVHRWWPKRPSR